MIYNITEQVWNPITSCVIYITAWILPAIILMVTFGGLAGNTNIVSGASECSCWCIPELGNVLPYAIPRDQPTAEYVWHIAKLVVAFGSLLFLNYLIVFVLLVILYWRIMRHIRTLREGYANVDAGLGNDIIQRAHSTAKRRIIYYLSTFIVFGFANVFLALLAVIYEGIRLRQGPVISTSYQLHTGAGNRISHEFHLAIHMIQVCSTELPPTEWFYVPCFIAYGLIVYISVTVPLQGFINAIVYGWTREDFLASMGVTNSKIIRGEDGELEVSVCQEENTENLINEGGGEEELEQTFNLAEHEHSLSMEGGRTYQSI